MRIIKKLELKPTGDILGEVSSQHQPQCTEHLAVTATWTRTSWTVPRSVSLIAAVVPRREIEISMFRTRCGGDHAHSHIKERCL